MKRIVTVAASWLLAGAVAQAQTTWSRLTFTAVDGVRTDGASTYITGVVEGAAEASEVKLYKYSGAAAFDMAECRRLALLAMSKPGQYKLSFEAVSYSAYTNVRDCKLERIAP